MKLLKKNNVTAMIVAMGLVTGLTGTALASASGYWTITQETVGAYGAWSSFGSPNLKQSSDNVASFNGDAMPAWWGYNVRLINGNGASRSNWTRLKKDQTTYSYNNSGLKGYYYYADIRSQTYEPNVTTVKAHFSADRK
ncbi:hypothetical protein QP343_05500 [Lactobacillus jensenii]|jgi:hypothetical protein|nr:hypothetical protein [Lactobacillus jensenii]ERJ42202.1 hypothetical protein N581_05120 [Lactobacillus jensenii MD IIE-70(2)]MCT7875190.1 hypothetical protein [Lactobacillus iners]EEQ24602.1 hypothetical protein LACJE0001_0957 [Lactobacillus jensenii 269-3]KRM50235.1 hypothetical protein FC45_GL000256 [Lactobacillus jensenii DSM 20557]MCF1777383.1 hypothetical protein [Lactobacillus jensenii]